MCPRCASAPTVGLSTCPGCGRSNAARGGGLDLLDDDARVAADRFGAQYTALRRREGWIGPDGREDPEAGEPRLWRGRLESAARCPKSKLPIPKLGDHIAIDGPWVLDTNHGWREIHPVDSIQLLPSA